MRHGNPHKGRTPVGVPYEYMLKTLNSETEECFVWPFANDGKGYGIIVKNGKNEYVHRIVCEETNGPAPEGKPLVRHICGNGNLGCFNPKHLCWSDQKENIADVLIHGTSNRGERHGMHKLSKEEALFIYNSKESRKKLASDFNVTTTNIHCIQKGKSWIWLTGHNRGGN